MVQDIRDPVESCYQVLEILIPAKDHPSIGIGNVRFELACHPGVWKWVRMLAITAIGLMYSSETGWASKL